MKTKLMRIQQAAACVLGMVALTSCSSWQNRYRPIDIDKDMPRVSELVLGVQKAIDDTAADPAWKPSKEFQDTQKECNAARTKAAGDRDKTCKDASDTARSSCRKVSGVAGPGLCADFLREAMEKCAAAAPEDPRQCGEAKLIAPPRITEAKLQLSAASESSAGASVELKLLSAKASRKLGRKHTLEIVLVPRAERVRELAAAALENPSTRARGVADVSSIEAAAEAKVRAIETEVAPADERGVPSQAEKPDMVVVESLRKALKVALDASLVSEDSALKKRQLTLKRMFYQFEVDYSRELGGEFKWTISPVSGTVQGKSGGEAGNILSIEVVR